MKQPPAAVQVQMRVEWGDGWHDVGPGSPPFGVPVLVTSGEAVGQSEREMDPEHGDVFTDHSSVCGDFQHGIWMPGPKRWRTIPEAG